jgi:transcriptional regulator with XRE-family HTH domain
MTTTKRPRTPVTTALRQAIAECGLSFLELQNRSGVVRQSLMKFARGERNLRLDLADKLMDFFNLEVRPIRKPRKIRNH